MLGNNSYVLYAIVAVGIFTVYMAIVNIFRSDRMKNKVRSANDSFIAQEEDDELGAPAFALFCENLLGIFGINPKADKALVMQLQQGGITSQYGPAYYMFFKKFIQPLLLVAGAFFFVRMLTVAGTTTSHKLLDLIVGLMLMIAGIMGASLYVTNKKQNRQKVLLRLFPEVLDLMLVCIESGLGLDAALAKCSQEMQKTHSVVTSELDRTRLELSVLSDRVQALQNLADRTEIIPFKSLVSALIQTEKFGTSLVDTLRVLSEDQRTARLLNAENKAARIPVLITIPLILCILPAFIMIILGPPIVRVIDQGGIFGAATPGR